MDGRQWTRDLISKKYKCGDKQLRKGRENKGQSVLDIHTIKKKKITSNQNAVFLKMKTPENP